MLESFILWEYLVDKKVKAKNIFKQLQKDAIVYSTLNRVKSLLKSIKTNKLYKTKWYKRVVCKKGDKRHHNEGCPYLYNHNYYWVCKNCNRVHVHYRDKFNNFIKDRYLSRKKGNKFLKIIKEKNLKRKTFNEMKD